MRIMSLFLAFIFGMGCGSILSRGWRQYDWLLVLTAVVAFFVFRLTPWK